MIKTKFCVEVFTEYTEIFLGFKGFPSSVKSYQNFSIKHEYTYVMSAFV